MMIGSAVKPSNRSSTPPLTSNWLGVAAPIGGIGFTVLYTILGATRQGYSQVRQLISALGAGSNGFALNIGFVVAGLLLVVGVVGFALSLDQISTRRRSATIVLLAVPLLGLVVRGFFHMDTNLLAHTIGAQLACALPIVTFPITAGLLWRRARKTSIWLVVSAVMALFALLGYMFLSTTTYTDFSSIAGGGTVGLWERVLAIVLFAICYPSIGIIGATAPRVRFRD